MFPDDGPSPSTSRRARLRARWDELLDATGDGRAPLVAGAALVGLVLGALWWLTRQAPPPVEATLPLVDATAPAATTHHLAAPGGGARGGRGRGARRAPAAARGRG